MEDLYQILGVPKTATAAEIKKAYRTLAMKYHPDRNPGDKSAEEQFKRVTAAYEVLSNETKRRQYDDVGASPFGSYTSQQQGYGSQQQYDPFGAWWSGSTQQGGYGQSRQQYANSSTGDAHDPFAEWFGGAGSGSAYDGWSSRRGQSYSGWNWYTRSTAPRQTRGQSFVTLIQKFIIFMLGVVFLRFWWLFFPIMPILCISAIVTGATGMANALRNIFTPARE